MADLIADARKITDIISKRPVIVSGTSGQRRQDAVLYSRLSLIGCSDFGRQAEVA